MFQLHFMLRYCLILLWLGLAGVDGVRAAEFVGRVVDASSGASLPARVYVRELAKDQWLFVKSVSQEKPLTAVPYSEQWVPHPESVEIHTTISADPFRVELNPGSYEIRVERGKEYLPSVYRVTVTDPESSWKHTFALQRWIDMGERGWYSGETHVHRRVRELPNVMLAEDLNVAFPVTYWTIQAGQAPDLLPSSLRSQGPSPWGNRVDYGHAPIPIDATHVIYPRNTEYEIFRINDRPHVLGAIFILNHKTRFGDAVPPIQEVARKAHLEGALLDLDKHSWPWAMMLVPIAKIDLYELANNSLWKTTFGFRNTTVKPAPYMKIAIGQSGMTERNWIDFGLQNYYALLNCGFRLRPTAGTASGVHPVPLGFGRVYVQLPQGFDGGKWIEGLNAGRSFVTTGPMVDIRVNQRFSGHVFQADETDRALLRVHGEASYSRPLDTIELVLNGDVVAKIQPQNVAMPNGAFRSTIDQHLTIEESGWLVLRCFQETDGHVRFAHTAPWHVEVGNRPVRPKRVEVQYLVDRVSREIDRNRDVLAPAALHEFESALQIYSKMMSRDPK